MPDDARETAQLTLSVGDGVSGVGREAWNRIANPTGAPYDPFLDWDFLEACESSGCARPATGWTPRPILLTDSRGELVGAAPLYVKMHSRGEFVFDHGWADALNRAGGDYYPKLLCGIPFTPASGRRLLADDRMDVASLRTALAGGAVQLADEAGLSSVHFNFLTAEEWEQLGELGLLKRTDQQFHWFNRGYATFDDFLATLASRKRKMIRKERATAQDGLDIVRLTGADLKKEHWDAFFRFYQDTGGRKWGTPYLNRKFFAILHERMADNVLMVLAMDGPEPVAGALNLLGSDAIYGRYWGRVVDRPFLHFEVCYYQAIEHAIDRGLARVEAGAQGEHKLARGYEPVLTRSAHWIAHPGLRDAVADYLQRERAAVSAGIEELATFTPFRKDRPGINPDCEPVDEESF